MFFHVKELQYDARPDRPDPVYAKKLQEILGGHFGEITVAMQYMFQGFNCRGEAKYRDMLLDIATEEWAHVEMIATMIARLLDGAPARDQEQAAANPMVHAVLAGMNPQHFIVSGLGARAVDAAGNPWTAAFMVASGNLMADFRDNLSKESHGRLQAVRLYEQTGDSGVRDMLAFLIARDTMHQNQWLAAIEELERHEKPVVPATFPQDREKQEVSYAFWNLSAGDESRMGRWAQGASIDGQAAFEYIAAPRPLGPAPWLHPAPPYLHNTPVPGAPAVPPMVQGFTGPNPTHVQQ